jgi:pSer/pThr/pTyr-binding forkhead associated (FHA) protein
MPKLTLVLDRKPVHVYELDQPVIRIGRGESMDVLIDNVSVSRRHAEIREENGAWLLRDLGSSNGTFLNGQRVATEQTLRPGDEISFGKFSILFERVLSDPVTVEPSPALAPRLSAESGGTLQMGPEEVERLQKASAMRRQAQLQWEAGEQRGTFYLESAGALVGRTDLCDLRVPAGPRQHVLVLRGTSGFEVRSLARFRRMRVGGQVMVRAALKSGDTIEIGGLRLTFMDEVR